MSTTKKLFIIFLILLVLAGGALAIYNFFIKSNNGSSGQTGNQTQILAVNQIGREKAFALTLGDSSQTIKYYTFPKGHVIESRFDGSAQTIKSSADLPDLAQIIWSPDNQKVIAYFGPAANPSKIIAYNYLTKQASPLNQNIKSIAWAPNSQKIVYHFQTPDAKTNNVSVADANGTNWHALLETRLEDFSLTWPGAQKIYLQTKTSGLSAGAIYSLDASNGDLKNLLSNLNGLAALWSPDGQKMLYQTTDAQGKNLKVFLADANGANTQALNLATLIAKCAWSPDSKKIFCAVPQSISEFATLPDDYLAGRVTFKDDFFAIDVATAKETKIAQSDAEQSFDAAELLVANGNGYLFFINHFDNLVYGMSLTAN